MPIAQMEKARHRDLPKLTQRVSHRIGIGTQAVAFVPQVQKLLWEQLTLRLRQGALRRQEGVCSSSEGPWLRGVMQSGREEQGLVFFLSRKTTIPNAECLQPKPFLEITPPHPILDTRWT